MSLDFNDLAQNHGDQAIQSCVEDAMPVDDGKRRFKLLSIKELEKLPEKKYLIKGVIA